MQCGYCGKKSARRICYERNRNSPHLVEKRRKIREFPAVQMAHLVVQYESKLQGAIGSTTVTKWEEWERIHAEQDARDRNIILAILAMIAVLALIMSLTAL
jgi:hypothetical protein